MTETQRAAMQQALEFCEELQGGCTDSDDGTVEAITVWCPEVIEALRAALAEQEQGRKKRKPKNSTTPLGIVCFEAYARSEVGSNRWDIAAEAVRAALAASEAN